MVQLLEKKPDHERVKYRNILNGLKKMYSELMSSRRNQFNERYIWNNFPCVLSFTLNSKYTSLREPAYTATSKYLFPLLLSHVFMH